MKALEHLRTINHHKWLVMKHCFKVGLYKQGLLHDDKVCIVSHIAGGCPKMDYGLCQRTLKAIGIDVAHHIMADLFLPCLCIGIVDIIGVGPELSYLLFAYPEAELFL